MQAVTITQITPLELETLIENSLRKVLNSLNSPSPEQSDRWLNMAELIEYLPDHPARATVYTYTSNRLIPFRKHGKKLRFLKSEIDFWLLNGQKRGGVKS